MLPQMQASPASKRERGVYRSDITLAGYQGFEAVKSNGKTGVLSFIADEDVDESTEACFWRWLAAYDRPPGTSAEVPELRIA